MADENHNQKDSSILPAEHSPIPDPAQLRLMAEKKVRPMPQDLEALSPAETRKILHELQVHQIELEMQNEELRRTQAELDASRARYFDLYDLAPVGYLTISGKGLILETNLTAANLLGVARGLLVKQPVTRFILKEDQDIFYRHRKQLLLTSEPQACELRMLKNDGTTFWMRMESVAVKDYHAHSGHHADEELLCRVVMSDITTLKQAEEAIHQAQKIEAIHQLAGGVAHDFNNMLGVIIGHSELALYRADSSNPAYNDLREIRNAAVRSANMTRQLLSFARRQMITPKVLDLNETIEGMMTMLRQLIGKEIDLVWLPGKNLWSIKADPSQIEQILGNLCTNAREAITGAGKITIETGTAAIATDYCARHQESIPGEYVLLTVSDTGCGMEKEILGRIFDPFFTTKQLGSGAGMGLPTVYGSVKQNNGFIDVKSSPGHGTTFNVFLPRHQAEQQRDIHKEGAVESGQGHETILMVEDEPGVLKMTTMMLEHLGYTVLPALMAKEAISLAERHSAKIHLLITDVIMPDMNGRDLAKNLLALHPHFKLLFMSGYTADVIAPHGELDDLINFIQKPFSTNDLAAKVREVLNSK